MRIPAVLLGVLSVVLLPILGEAEGAPDASPYAPLAFLVGGVWSAALPADADGAGMRIDFRCEWATNKQGLRFESASIRAGKSIPYVSGMYVCDPVKHKMLIFYTDESAGLTQGVVSSEDGVLVHDLSTANKDGTVDVVRARMKKVGPDTYTNEISMQVNGQWKKIVDVRYERHQ